MIILRSAQEGIDFFSWKASRQHTVKYMGSSFKFGLGSLHQQCTSESNVMSNVQCFKHICGVVQLLASTDLKEESSPIVLAVH